jgi:hypothetical protein
MTDSDKDLTQRLRQYLNSRYEVTMCYNGLRDEAADRIEQLEAKLTKAVDVIKCILASTYADHNVGYHVALYGAKELLAELEGEPLGAEFEAVWDANKAELYQE